MNSLSATVQISLTSLAALLAGLFFSTRFRKSTSSSKDMRRPPIIAIPEREILERPRDVYEKALAEHGPVIAVKRKGRLEYIVDRGLTHEVLTRNDLFSFEEGTAFVLNIHYFHKYFAAFFVDIDDLVKSTIITRMPVVVEQVSAIFFKHADDLRRELHDNKQGMRYLHALNYTHRSISEAMALVIFGPGFVTSANIFVIEKVAHDLAVVTGIYQNTSWWGTTFPNAWRMFTWIKILTTTIPLFYMTIGSQVWRKLRSLPSYSEKTEDKSGLYKDNVLSYLACRYSNKDNATISISAYLRTTFLILGVIFASVHQTASVAVWILYELAVRPEYILSLREELSEIAGIDRAGEDVHISYDHLQKAVRLDSFIREVLRTKGDTISTYRLTTADVHLGGYIIPKGFPVIPITSLSHMSAAYHGLDAEEFDGGRWIESGKQAVTVNQTYFPFGLGRWACPGRVLAVAEMKMIVWAVICQSMPVLRGGAYTVPDPLNVTSVAPKGEMTLIPY